MVDSKILKDKIQQLSNLLEGNFAISLYIPYLDFYFAINDKEIYPAASLIKLPILAALLYLVDDFSINLQLRKEDKVSGAGILQYLDTPKSFTLKDLIYLMITISDNTATNLIIDYISQDKINYIIKNVFNMKDTILGNKLMINPKGKTKNFTTAYDINLLLKLFALDNKILKKEKRDFAIEVMKKQEFNEKIPALLWNYNLNIAHKTGEISGVREDSAIIYLDKVKFYLLTVLTKDVKDPYISDFFIAKISYLIFKYIKGVS